MESQDYRLATAGSVLLEQGRYVPSLSLAMEIARILGTNVESLFELSE